MYDNNSFLDVSESLEARYTGLRDWSFYARGEWLEGDGTIQEQEIDAETRATALTRKTDSDRFTQKYTVGANWYATSRLTMGAQYYHKIRDNNYDHSQDSTPNGLTSGDRYPAFLETQKFDQDDVNFRVTLRPMANLTLISRYDFQMADIETGVPFLGEIESAEMQSHIFGETITWSPINRLYLQGSLNYVFDHTTTPVEDFTGGVIQDFHNDYWNVSGMVGVNLDTKTDLQFQYYYYRADNYEDNSTIGMPYGASGEEHGVTATLMRQLTRAMRWSLKYGFFTNHERTYGGNTDYNAHLVYTSIQYRF